MHFAVEGAIAVLGIAEDGVPDMRKMGADLMRLACMQGDFEKAQPLFFAQNAVFGDDGLPSGAVEDAHAGGGGILLKIGSEDGVFFPKAPLDEGEIALFGAPLAEGVQKLVGGSLGFRKDEKPFRVAVEAVQKEALPLPKKRRKDGLRLHAALLIADDNVFILVKDGKRLLPFLGGRQEVLHSVARMKGYVLPHFAAVDAHVAALQEGAEGKGRLGVMRVGEVFERSFLAYGV